MYIRTYIHSLITDNMCIHIHTVFVLFAYLSEIHQLLSIYIRIYIYICMHAYMHTYINKYIYIYVYISA